MSDPVRPHRQQPTRLHCPWDSPGKNTGMGCHFLLQCMKVKSESEVAQSCLTLSDLMDCSPLGSSVHGIFQARVLEWDAIAFSGINHYYLFIFNQRIIALQCCVGFCHTSTRISHRYTHVPSLLNFPSISYPFPPLQTVKGTGLCSLHYTANSLSYLFYTW